MKFEQLTIGGLLGAAATMIAALILGLLLHFRETRKIDAAAKITDAESASLHWRRFQDEIARLEARITRLEQEVHDCHKDKAAVESEFSDYKRGIERMGDARQVAQLVASTIHADKVKGQNDG